MKAFKARLEAQGEGGAWTIIRIPFDVEEVFGSRARVPVKGKIDGFPFRAALSPMGGGKHCLMVNKTVQKGAGVGPGDTARVELEPDEVPRPVAVPRDLQQRLARSRKAKAFFEGLSPSHKRAYVDWIVEAKKAETRARRLEKTIAMLEAGEKRM